MKESILKCNSKTGISSEVNLKLGTIDEKKILNKLIIHSKNKYSEKLFHSQWFCYTRLYSKFEIIQI